MHSSDWWVSDGGKETATASHSSDWRGSNGGEETAREHGSGGEETEETVEKGIGSGGEETEETVEKGIASDGQPWTLEDITSYRPRRPRYRYYAKPWPKHGEQGESLYWKCVDMKVKEVDLTESKYFWQELLLNMSEEKLKRVFRNNRAIVKVLYELRPWLDGNYRGPQHRLLLKFDDGTYAAFYIGTDKDHREPKHVDPKDDLAKSWHLEGGWSHRVLYGRHAFVDHEDRFCIADAEHLQ